MNDKKYLDLSGLEHLMQYLVSADELTDIVNVIGNTIQEVDNKVPEATAANNGKILKIANGEWTIGTDTSEIAWGSF